MGRRGRGPGPGRGTVIGAGGRERPGDRCEEDEQAGESKGGSSWQKGLRFGDGATYVSETAPVKTVTERSPIPQRLRSFPSTREIDVLLGLLRARLGRRNAEEWSSLVGTASNDVIAGTTGRDIVALGGADTVSGGGGADVICGGDGPDILKGDAGGDWIEGGANADDISGGAGDDTLDGGLHNDSLRGDGGRDTCVSGEIRMSSCEIT